MDRLIKKTDESVKVLVFKELTQDTAQRIVLKVLKKHYKDIERGYYNKVVNALRSLDELSFEQIYKRYDRKC